MPSHPTAVVFSHYLRLQGITNELEQEQGGWSIWVHSEDEWEKAQTLFRRFLGDPEDPTYKLVSSVPMEEEAELSEILSRHKTARKTTATEDSARRSYGMGPLTLALVILCSGIGLLSEFGQNMEMLSPLFISPFVVEGSFIKWQSGLSEFFSGEFWRLFSPIFVHFGILHLALNMFWLVYLGSMVEACERTPRLVGLVLLIAALSNLGQYCLSGPSFGGMSGVLYGLLGYIWMKCRFQPGSGYFLDLRTVTFMLIWFFVCLAGIIPGIANGAHAFGLLSGVSWGFLSAKREVWKAARA